MTSRKNQQYVHVRNGFQRHHQVFEVWNRHNHLAPCHEPRPSPFSTSNTVNFPTKSKHLSEFHHIKGHNCLKKLYTKILSNATIEIQKKLDLAGLIQQLKSNKKVNSPQFENNLEKHLSEKMHKRLIIRDRNSQALLYVFPHFSNEVEV